MANQSSNSAPLLEMQCSTTSGSDSSEDPPSGTSTTLVEARVARLGHFTVKLLPLQCGLKFILAHCSSWCDIYAHCDNIYPMHIVSLSSLVHVSLIFTDCALGFSFLSMHRACPPSVLCMVYCLANACNYSFPCVRFLFSCAWIFSSYSAHGYSKFFHLCVFISPYLRWLFSCCT